MKSALLGLGIVVGLGLLYILAFRINHRDEVKKNNCGGNCSGCSGCPANKELKDVIK